MNKIYNQDCLIGMKNIPDNSVDVILTDPPYKYLKNQKLEVDFDEAAFFAQAKRVLKKDGFIVLFGRGTSFYRWNTMLADLGFTFKEEIVWNKVYTSSPLMAMNRVHETVSIHTKGKGTINRVKVPYLEMKGHDIDSIVQDIKRLKTVLNNPESLSAVKRYLETRQVVNCSKTNRKFFATTSSDYKGPGRVISCVRSVNDGFNEKTIIKQARDHYTAIHPTQKPARLLERLLALVTKEGDVVLDPFSGSGATAIACTNTDRRYIGYELDKEYYDKSIERLSAHTNDKSA